MVVALIRETTQHFSLIRHKWSRVARISRRQAEATTNEPIESISTGATAKGPIKVSKTLPHIITTNNSTRHSIILVRITRRLKAKYQHRKLVKMAYLKSKSNWRTGATSRVATLMSYTIRLQRAQRTLAATVITCRTITRRVEDLLVRIKYNSTKLKRSKARRICTNSNIIMITSNSYSKLKIISNNPRRSSLSSSRILLVQPVVVCIALSSNCRISRMQIWVLNRSSTIAEALKLIRMV